MPGRLIEALAAAPRLAVLALRAWATREPGDWAGLARQWSRLGAVFPTMLALTRIEARLWRAARTPEAAIAAAMRALALAPGDRDVLLELGRARRQAGRREEAIADFVAAARAGAATAAAELLRYGARSHLPEPEPGVFARDHAANWLASCAIPAAPETLGRVHFRVSVTGTPEQQAATRASLAAQTYADWSEQGDPRGESWNLPLPAGAQLHPEALGWLAWAAAETGAPCVRADHGVRSADGHSCQPALLPGHDPLWVDRPGGIARLRASQERDGATCHVPLVLMSLPDAPVPTSPLPDAEPPPISVIIPTRDNPKLLAEAAATLLATAAHPDRIELVIIDNGSRSPPARALLDRLTERERTVIVPFPQAFNWSRANNLGARAASGSLLLFLNDDTAMQTAGWDRILAGLLAQDDVGLVGARMVYPDGRIQHGGFVLGMDNGPQHEGRWMAGDDAGPAGRWTAIRAAAAVTGAFMAIRRDRLAALGGFDEQTFAVDFADLDLCLKVRAGGQLVAYCGAITLTHHESVSRGLNLGRAKRRRMARERAAFEQRWGAMASNDPYYHPAWVRTGCSYDGLRRLSAAEVCEAMKATALRAG